MSENVDDIEARIVRNYRLVSPGGRPPSSEGKGELDSMALLEFVMRIEREFDITVEPRELNDRNFKTLKATLDFVRGKLGEKTR